MTFLRLLCAFLLLAPTALRAEEYLVSVSDTLHLRVMEWKSVEGVVEEWPTVAGEYPVGIDGTIAVPFLGQVQAAGRSAAEIGQDIAAGLTQRFALVEAPDASVQVLRYGPVFVSGLVRTPGQFEFRPGMTVQQALSMAGGLAEELRRATGAAREAITVQGNSAILEEQQARLAIRRARLEAELAQPVPAAGEAPVIPAVAGLPPGLRGEEMVAAETAIMAARAARLQSEIQAIDSQAVLLEREVAVLEEKTLALERQRDLTRQELESARSLSERGLLANSRLIDSERALATIENQVLDVSSAMLRARQGLAGTERDRRAVVEAQVSEIAATLQQVEAEAAETAHRLATQRLLSVNALAFAGAVAVDAEGWPAPQIVILRAGQGAVAEIAAGPATILRPGDVVEVRLESAPTN